MTEVVNVLRMKAEQQSLSLSINLRGSIPETIQADSTRLRQILMNLVGNAIKFTAEGGVRIVTCMEEKDGQPFMRFEVTDTGIGMTPEQMSRLFQEFMQADSSVTRRFGGTGLGLAISKRLTEAMGGQIAVRSELGVGSTFYFSIATGNLSGIPMLDAEQASEKFRSALRSKQQGLRVYCKPARVLITDDTPANRQLAGLVLRKAGLTVDEAENGAVAVEKASLGIYDLLLMDMQMPVMDGFTATKTLRDQGLQTPILAFTANVMEQDRQRCVAAGCSGFLTKPINIDLLLSTIAEYLETTDAPPELSAPVGHSAAGIGMTKQNAASAPTALSGDSLDEILDQLPGHSAARALGRNLSMETETGREARATVRKPIYSTLPLDIPEFREIVESFVGCMDDTMKSLREAQARMDYQEVREIAHRLKGTGGTVGFAAFTEPSRKLQFAAEERDDETIEAMLVELEDISSRIELPVEV
jgi:CheY-like chemotaxis protein